MRIGGYKESYASDEAIWRSPAERAWFVALLAGMALFPFVAGDYYLFLACLLGINIIAATGINILTGYTGLISLGHAGFIGVGAYGVAVLSTRFGLPFYICLPLAGLLAALVGLVVGVPSLRIKGLYLAIATLAAQFILGFVFLEWEDVTGGGRGLTLPPAEILGLRLTTEKHLYVLIAVVLLPLMFFARNLFRTRIGRAFVAIRDRDISAEVMGIDLFKYKLMAFAVSSFYAGIAGGLMAYFFKVVTPEQFNFSVSIFFLAAIIVGGLGTILGGVLGAIFLTLVPELLKGVFQTLGPDMIGILSPAREVLFGVLIVGFLILEPHGLAEIWRRLRRSFDRWPFRT